MWEQPENVFEQYEHCHKTFWKTPTIDKPGRGIEQIQTNPDSENLQTNASKYRISM